MSKRDDLYEEARQLYVIHGLSRIAIAARLSISARTLQTWSTDNKDGKGTWDEQKSKLIDGDETFHAELMRLGTIVTRKIADDLLNSTLDPKQVSTLDRIVKVALKVLEYSKKNPQTKDLSTGTEKRDKLQSELRRTLGLAG